MVAGRTREIGIRIALGAHPRDIARTVAAQGMRPVLAGIVLGLGGALAGARVLTSLLFRVDPWDPLTFLGSTAVITGVAALACFVPARSAARTSPTEAMRTTE